jgi:hypothetical protein
MLTAKQLLGIATRRSVPPWRLGELRTIFKVPPTTPLSLRSVLNGVQGQKVVFFVEVRDASILKSVHTLAELQAMWKKSVPTKATWAQLSQILSSPGGSLKFLSNNWLSTGITGRVGSFAAVPTIRITDHSFEGVVHIAEAAGAASILLIELAGEVPTAASPYLVVAGIDLGVVSIVTLAGVGLLEMISKDPEQATDPGQVIKIPEVTIVSPDPNVIQIPEVTIYGAIPPGVNPQDVDNAPTIDPNELPEGPPDPPPPDPGP